MTPRDTILYCRLSRADLDAPGNTAQKFESYVRRGQELAARHGLPPIREENIYCEQVSGGKLANRPLLLAILERCRRGEVSHLLAADWDRILRGDKRDEQDIEDALCDGRVTVITETEVYAFGDDFDSLSLDIRSVLARQERKKYSRRLRAANLDRVKQGKRPCGWSSYGYVWTKDRYDGRTLIDPAHHEIVGTLELVDPNAALQYALTHLPECVQRQRGEQEDGSDRLDRDAYLTRARRQGQPGGELLPGVVCTAGEYHTLCEIVRRAWTESTHAIANSLTERFRQTGAPIPPRRGANQSLDHWQAQAVRYLLTNPYIAGVPTSRYRAKRGSHKQTVLLPREQWVQSEEQEYPHPIRPDDQERLEALIASRKHRGAPKPTSSALLTGLLRCSEGQPMYRGGDFYFCHCHKRANSHPGVSVKASLIEAEAFRLFSTVLQSLPAELTESRPDPTDRATLAGQLRETTKRLREAREYHQFLLDSAPQLLRAWTAEEYAAQMERTREERERWEREVETLRATLETPDVGEIVSLARAVRAVGVADWWEALTVAERREALRSLLASVQIVAPQKKGGWVRFLTVTMQPVAGRYWTPPEGWKIEREPSHIVERGKAHRYQAGDGKPRGKEGKE